MKNLPPILLIVLGAAVWAVPFFIPSGIATVAPEGCERIQSAVPLPPGSPARNDGTCPAGWMPLN